MKLPQRVRRAATEAATALRQAVDEPAGYEAARTHPSGVVIPPDPGDANYHGKHRATRSHQ